MDAPGTEESIEITNSKPKKKKKFLKRIPADFSEFYGLTTKNRMFLREYIKDFNGTQAAIRVGAPPKYAYAVGRAILQKVTVQNALAEWEKHLSSRFIHTKDRILKELSIIGYSDLGDYLTSEGDVRVQNLKELPPQVTRAIKKLRVHRVTKKLSKKSSEGNEGDEIEDLKVEIELYDKQQALINMGKELGMFRDRKEVTGADGAPLIPVSPNVIVFDFGDK